MMAVVGMSGGVDSAVAALLLKQQGHSVAGAIMKIWDENLASCVSGDAGNACFGPNEEKDIEGARRVCDKLDISLHVVDCVKEYREIVLANFRGEYASGRTPNPCALCNPGVKFGALPSLLARSGVLFDRFATGHYARVARHEASDRFFVRKGADAAKDQSYFLYRLSQEQLAMACFPLGDLRKEQVRRIARDEALPVHDRKESQDFYGGDYTELLGAAKRRGRIVHTDGRALGEHNGLWNYTIGQRKGLGVADGKPLYVVAIHADRNELIVGGKERLLSAGLAAADLNWFLGESRRRAAAKIRSTAREVPCSVFTEGATARVTFDEPQSAVTPGQSVVFYDGDACLGGGVILHAIQ
ncbi:MAG: tRNA 2-thiouridine(34) synthase MnmA [Verrucomicrobiota bacterium]|nr:tRNA 2-thiouridine(34) synthase MnmA [Verrucomicrobiota bacterium]